MIAAAVVAVAALACGDGGTIENGVAERVAELMASYPRDTPRVQRELEEIGSPAVEHIVRALWCRTELTLLARQFFVSEVNRIPGQVAMRGLIQLLSHWEPFTRGESAACLGMRRSPEAIPALLGLLDDESIYLTTTSTDPAREDPIAVQVKAVEALEAITGRTRGSGQSPKERVGAWARWRASRLR
jgi:hypothetical protein